jgi:hypothetical protein
VKCPAGARLQVAHAADVGGKMDDRVGLMEPEFSDVRLAQVAVLPAERVHLGAAPSQTVNYMASEKASGTGHVDGHAISRLSGSIAS